MPAGGWRGWLGPSSPSLSPPRCECRTWPPRAFAFDETYYAKDGISLLQFGNEQQFVKDANDIILNSDGNPWTVNPFAGGPEYVVHPPFGKWVIAAGEGCVRRDAHGLAGGVLICGLIAVVLIARIVRRLLRSNLWGTVAAC